MGTRPTRRWLLPALSLLPGLAYAAAGVQEGVHITSILVNGVVRIAAIAAGVYVVKLGHDTFVRGVTGEFEFEGSFGRLKGSAPGLLFVLLGCLAIGWALNAMHSGTVPPQEGAENQSSVRGSSVPPPAPLPAAPGNAPASAPEQSRPRP